MSEASGKIVESFKVPEPGTDIVPSFGNASRDVAAVSERATQLTPELLAKVASATFSERLHLVLETPEAKDAMRALTTAALGTAIGTHEFVPLGPLGSVTDAAELGYYVAAKTLFKGIDLMPDVPFLQLAGGQLLMEGGTGGIAPSFTMNVLKQMGIDREKGRLGDAANMVLYVATGRSDYYKRLVEAGHDLDNAAAEFTDAEGTKVEIVGRVDKYGERAERIAELEGTVNNDILSNLERISLGIQNASVERPEDIRLKVAKGAALFTAVGFGVVAGYEIYTGLHPAWETLQQGGEMLKSAASLGSVDWKSLLNLEIFSHPGEVVGPAFAAYSEHIKIAYAKTLGPLSETLTQVARTAVAAASSYGVSRMIKTNIRQNSTVGPAIGRMGEWVSIQGGKIKEFFSKTPKDDEALEDTN